MNYFQLVKSTIPTLNFEFPYTVEDYSKNLYLENYHCHKDFSNTIIADSPDNINAYAKRIHEFNGKCLYSGEHGTQGNQFEVYKVADAENLKYRHSTEAYWVKDRFEQDRSNCHMILVAKNAQGREDINYVLSMANINGYFYRPRIDLDLLFQIPKDNVIVTSACLAGWNYEDASDVWLKIHDYFGDNFYFEVQYHNTDPQKRLNEKILSLSEKENIEIICGLDSHYITDVGKEKRDQILKYKKIQYPEENGWYMDYPDTPTVIERFKEQGILSDVNIIRSIMNTNVFVNECEDIVLDKHFKIPTIYPDKTYEEKCKIYKNILNQAYKKETLKSKEKINGIKYEANQVIDSGVVDYFLTSKAIVEDAVNNQGGILTTTSRGSAASYITNKLIGLTTVDRFNADIPIYPERFLTKERVLAGQMPDIDLNVATQEPFVKASRKLLGEHGCYPLMAVEKLKKKAAWQLYAGANKVDPQTANQISKYIAQYDDDVKHADDNEKELINIEDYIPNQYLDLYKKSNEYQNITINLKCHACGHMIFNGDIRREVGLISAVSEITGKRTICAAIEGGYLDEFGYVKEDFLIVDSVYLTYKFFKSIGKEVPSFEELRKMINGDKYTWDIYKKGITCCVNQCEKKSTTTKVKKYAPTNLSELSSFIAAIRPGFASLLNVFLNREDYSTGEEKIDDLLSDTAHFSLYQESLMKVLSYLSLPMTETYGVIKAISKKKLKGEKKEHLLKELQDAWGKEFHNMDNFNNVWEVIENSARYAFNAPHAWSMAGDSAYQAWFKAHYTKKFYEVAINHYQDKGKKDKIDALVKEALKFYGYHLGTYSFGDDNRRVHIEDETKIIYPNLSSVKGFGEQVANDLYHYGQYNYKSFVEVLDALLNRKDFVDHLNKENNIEFPDKSIGKTIIDKLIKIHYFENFGEVNTLLEIKRLYELIRDAKVISKDKAIKENINFDVLRKYSNETEKQFRNVDSNKLLDELINNIKVEPITLKEELDYQHDILGVVTFIDSKLEKNLYYVTDIDEGKSIVNVSLYEVFSGKTREVKLWVSQFSRNRFSVSDLITVIKIDKKNKKEFSGEIDPITNKRIYVDVPDKYEYWLSSFYKFEVNT